MIKKPTKIITTIALLLCFSVLLLLLSTLIKAFDMLTYDPFLIFQLIPYSFYGLIMVLFLVNYLLITCHPRVFFFFKVLFFVSGFFIINSLFFNYFKIDFLWIICNAAAIIFLYLSHRIFKNILPIYQDPKLQWWRQKRRFVIQTKCNYRFDQKNFQLEGAVRDLSESGILVIAQATDFKNATITPQVGDVISVAFQCLLIPLILTGRLVRIQATESTIYLGGVFEKNDAQSLQKLSTLTTLLERIGFQDRNQKIIKNNNESQTSLLDKA